MVVHFGSKGKGMRRSSCNKKRLLKIEGLSGLKKPDWKIDRLWPFEL